MQEGSLNSVLAVILLLSVLAGCNGGGGAALVCGLACGDKNDSDPPPAASNPSVDIPVGGANSPLIGVTMRVDCANGASATGVIGNTSNPGIGTISVAGGCTAPIKITATGSGKMRPIGAKADASEDMTYDPGINLPVSAVLTELPITSNPAVVNPVTTLVAEKVAPGIPGAGVLSAVSTSTLSVAQAAVAAALGISASEVTSDYRSAKVAAAATRITHVAALAASQAATAGIPAAVSATLSLGGVLAQGLANQAGAGSDMTSAAGVATAVRNIDPATLDVTASPTLANIDDDSVRVGNMINSALTSSPASSIAELSNFVAQSVAAAQATTLPTAQQQQTINDAKARMSLAAMDAIQTAAARMLTDVANTVSSLGTAEKDTKLAIAMAAAARIINDQTTAMAQTGNSPATLAAQAKAVADTISSAIKSDITANIQALAALPNIGKAGVAAALVGQAEKAAANLTPATSIDAVAAAAKALAVTLAIKDVAAPAGASPATQAAFEAAIQAIAAMADPSSATNSPANTAAITATVTALQTQLLSAIGGSGAAVTTSTVALARQLAQSALQSALGSASALLNISAPPTTITVGSTLPTTTTTTAQTTTTTTAVSTTTTSGSTTTTTLPT